MAPDKVHPREQLLASGQLADGHGDSLTGTRAGAQLLESALELLPTAVVVADAHTGRYVYANAKARELLPGQIVGSSVNEVATERGRDVFGKPYPMLGSPLGRAAFGGERVDNETVEAVLATGESVRLSVSAVPLRDQAGVVVAAVAVIEDRRERDGRERIEREFITNAAHELRTPLAAIASAIEVLESGAKNLPSERDVFLQHIARQSDRLHRLTRALLLLARSEVHDEEPRLEIVAIRDLLLQTAAGLSVAPGVVVRVECATDLAALTSRDLVDQAITNVASNAARYTSSGTIELRCSVQQGLAVIEIADTGPGIPAAALGHVFERFYRAGSRDQSGFGLGLAIARRALESVGGRISIESTVGVGTTVSISLPLAQLVEA